MFCPCRGHTGNGDHLRLDTRERLRDSLLQNSIDGRDVDEPVNIGNLKFQLGSNADAHRVKCRGGR